VGGVKLLRLGEGCFLALKGMDAPGFLLTCLLNYLLTYSALLTIVSLCLSDTLIYRGLKSTNVIWKVI